MNPISNTAFYCCGIRMLDAQSAKPICNDTYAERFMDARGMAILRRFAGELKPNLSNVARHRYIDDELRSRLLENRQLRIVLVGCGFDSRAFRLPGGDWIELDEPALIAYKNDKVPAQQCGNNLTRIAIDFAKDSLEEKLAPYADDRPTVVIIEGVTMYVPAASLELTLRVIAKLFSQREVIADLMTRKFAESFGKSVRNIIVAMGANMAPLEDPVSPFDRAGYKQKHSESAIGLGMRYRGWGFMQPLLRLAVPDAMKGYTVRTFE